MPYTTLDSTTTTLSASVATVDCDKQVRSWRLLRSLLKLLVRGCNCILIEESDLKHKKSRIPYRKQPKLHATTAVTGTIFGFRHGKVRFCIQANPGSTTPILLLELAIPTATLAREMKGGFLRIALESERDNPEGNGSNPSFLLSMPVWTMYCNGRKVGFSVKRSPSKVDVEVLQKMESLVVGAGAISGKEVNSEDDIMYLRGKFQRVHGSSNSESFHLIDPDCNVGQQELSFFFLRY